MMPDPFLGIEALKKSAEAQQSWPCFKIWITARFRCRTIQKEPRLFRVKTGALFHHNHQNMSC